MTLSFPFKLALQLSRALFPRFSCFMTEEPTDSSNVSFLFDFLRYRIISKDEKWNVEFKLSDTSKQV